MMTCPQCDRPMRLIEAIDVKAEFVDVYNEEGELEGEALDIGSSSRREFWLCDGCGAEWPGGAL